MSNIAIFKTGKIPEYRISVNTRDYVVDPNVPKSEVVPLDPDVIINPDISSVSNVPLKYWKRSGNNILEMTQSEKDTLEAQLLQSRRDYITDPANADLKDILTALIKVINNRLSTGQKITRQEFIDAIKLEIQ